MHLYFQKLTIHAPPCGTTACFCPTAAPLSKSIVSLNYLSTGVWRHCFSHRPELNLDYPGSALWRHCLSQTSSLACKVGFVLAQFLSTCLSVKFSSHFLSTICPMFVVINPPHSFSASSVFPGGFPSMLLSACSKFVTSQAPSYLSKHLSSCPSYSQARFLSTCVSPRCAIMLLYRLMS